MANTNPSVTIADSAAVFGSPIVFTVTLNAASTKVVTINYATVGGTASTGDGDYSGVASAKLTIPVGSKTGKITIQTKPVNASSNKSFTIQLSNPVNAVLSKATAIGTLKPKTVTTNTTTPNIPTPVTPTPPVVVKPPVVTNVVNLSTGGDIGTAITNLKDSQQLVLATNGKYELPPSTVVLSANNAKIIGNNSTVIRPVNASSSTGLAIRGSNLEIYGITFDSNKPMASFGPAKVGINALRVYSSGLNIHDCISRNVDDFVFLEPTASNAKITHCSATDEIRGDWVYIAGTNGVTIDSCTAVKSQQEHIVRIELADVTNLQTAANIVITNCNFTNSNAKETIACRNALGPVTITGNTLGAWVRSGQVAATGDTPPTFSVGSITITNNHFTSKAYVQIDQGTKQSLVSGNTFDGYAAYVPVSIQGPNANCQITNNNRKAMPGEKINSPFYRTYGLGNADVVTNTNNVEN